LSGRSSSFVGVAEEAVEGAEATEDAGRASRSPLKERRDISLEQETRAFGSFRARMSLIVVGRVTES
jgi:hypothetical protein